MAGHRTAGGLVVALLALMAILPASAAAQRPPRKAAPPAAAPVAATADVASTEELKREVVQEVASLQKLSQEMVDEIFSFAELGYEERNTAAYVEDVLRRNGFAVQAGCADMPTCFVASYGSGKPVIGLIADIDGLPETSQTPGIPWHQPLVEGAPGHGEGHNSGQAVQVVAAIAVSRVLARHHLPGTVRVYPGVAEELVGSRTYMVNAGLFQDVDAMLSAHVGSAFGTSWGLSGSGLVSTIYNFHGRSSHAAGAPWAGRSALDAAELFDVGWNFRREHLRLQQRSHDVIVNGGSQPNVVPSEASVWYYFRELDYPHIQGLHALGDTMAIAAAMMTGTSWDQRLVGAAWPFTGNKPIAEAEFANIRALGYPQWEAADLALAKAAQRELKADTIGLNTVVKDTIVPRSDQGMGGPSDDVAEVSWNVPTIVLGYPANIPGMIGHNWSSGIAMATPIAHKGSNWGSRAQAMTAIDLLTNPKLLADAWSYFRDLQTRDVKWQPLIPPGTKPFITINDERMARYRPALEKLRYDPKKYGSYLEQLGVRYPTTERPATKAAADTRP